MLAIIGGSGLSRLDILTETDAVGVQTPFAPSTVEITRGNILDQRVAFLPRHGKNHVIPPHRINYRANLWALHHLGVTDLIGINAVGGINPQMVPGQLAVPDQLIDYSYGREHTLYDENLTEVVHIDFTHPYSRDLRQLLILAIEEYLEKGDDSDDEKLPMTRGVYGCTQGPRLETAAEIAKMRHDGCDMVGMTGMPEAALARELGMRYVCLALTVNRAAGLDDRPITMAAINHTLGVGMEEVRTLLPIFVRMYRDSRYQR